MPTFSCRQDSVISISSRLGGKFASTSIFSRRWANHGSRSWTGEMLTERVSSGDQRLDDKAFGQFGDGADVFGDGDEDFRADRAERGRMPAGQHFKAGQAASGEVDLLFVERHEFARRDAVPDAGFQLAAKTQFALHRYLEPAVAVPAMLLGMVHGDIGHVHHGLGISLARIACSSRVAAGKADGHRGLHVQAIDPHRARHGIDNAAGQPVDNVFA